MNSQELRNLQEAYLEVVENQQLDEALTGERAKKAIKKPGGMAYTRKVSADPEKRATRGGRGGESDFGAGDRGAGNKAAKRAGKSVSNTRPVDESYDYYDIILSHLLDEGYAETPEAAESIMVNMSEEWRDSIVEADSLAAMQARREKRLARQRKQMGTSSTGQDFGHDYGISSAERKKRQQAEFDKFVGKKTKK